jgi:hypothetical protein
MCSGFSWTIDIITGIIISPMRILLLAFIAVVLACAGSVKAADQSKRSMDIRVSVGNITANSSAVNASCPASNQSCIVIASQQSYALQGNLSVPLFIYRGSTLKRTVYVWVQNASGNIVSSKSKLSLPSRFSYYNIPANISFSKCIPLGDYVIFAEGLGLNVTKDVRLESGCSMAAQASAGKVEFQVISSPDSVTSGTQFRTVIVASNPTSEDMEIDAWSYVYKSSRCYSGEREQNKKSINLPSFSNITFELENTVNASAGDYTLKIKLLRSDRKTADEVNLPISVEGDASAPTGTKQPLSLVTGKAVAVKNISSYPEKRKLLDFNQSNRSGVVYLSSSAKAGKLTVYLMMLVLVILLVILIFKKL